MRLPFLPREPNLLQLLQESGANIRETAARLLELMESYEGVAEKVAEISRLEEVGDRIIHTIMQGLHRSFITPLDREDIAQLGERLDDVVDEIEESARHMVEYRIEQPTEKARELARIIMRCAEALDRAIGLLPSKGSSKRQEILRVKDELNILEEEADQVTSRAMGELFASYPPLEVLKWKEVYEHLEKTTDVCEEIASVLEGIVLKST